ncbi:hypothetical protein [Tautonia marina]|uniref:hypothetical protein n=1 Tax=Tautonia marina TaxID=2653855 RepID=UPI001260DFB4|nr:hypothetical protein [Tautonia marina]
MTSFFGKSGDGSGNGDPLASRLEQIFRIAGIVGIVGLLLCIVGAFFDVQQVLRSYLIAYIFWFGLPFACLSLLLLNHLAGGTWGLILRRPLEAGASTFLLMTPLFLPLAFGINQIYPWAGAEHGTSHSSADDHAAEGEHPDAHSDSQHAAVSEEHGEYEEHGHTSHFNHKEIWFQRPFYFARSAGYFAIWGGLAFLLVRWSNEQDRVSNPSIPTRRMALLGAPGLILAFLTGTFAMFDWGMSLDPDWYSTIYGAMLIVGMGLQTFALLNIVTTLLADRGALGDIVQPKRLRDLGNLMLAFVMLWAYTSYSQFLIVWSGDLSEEIPWYLQRSQHGWQYVVGFLAIFHFFLPFFVLLFRSNKEKATRLRAIASFIFVIHLVDLYWLLGPSLGYQSPVPHLLDLAAILGLGGLWLASFVYFLNSRPLLANHDPGLVELRHHDAAHASHSEGA